MSNEIWLGEDRGKSRMKKTILLPTLEFGDPAPKTADQEFRRRSFLHSSSFGHVLYHNDQIEAIG